MKRVLVCGASGFIGAHLVKRLRADGHYVIGIGRSLPKYETSYASTFYRMDLRYDFPQGVYDLDEVYQCAGETGGLGFLEDKRNDASLLRDNLQINLNVLEACRRTKAKRFLFVSSGCVYPRDCIIDIPERAAYPANPMNEFGWASLTVERLCAAYAHHLETRTARVFSTYGPQCTWTGGKERAPAALCRKVAEAEDNTSIDVWGDGSQVRSFMYVDDAVEGIIRVMRSECSQPVNIGSPEDVTVDELAATIIVLSGKKLEIRYVDGPVGAASRNADNTLLKKLTDWEPDITLREGLARLYPWVADQVALTKAKESVV